MRARLMRQAFTLVELMIVVGIIFALSALGISSSRELIPRFKTRQAAYEFARHAEFARQLAMTERQETRILMVEYDSDHTDPETANKGLYRIQMGNRNAGSTLWDTIPFEKGTADDYTAFGSVDLSQGHIQYKKGVSIEDWGTLLGPGSGNQDAIVFSPRGMVTNPPSDFNNLGNGNGNIEINFVNKPSAAHVDGDPEVFTVRIYRSGMIRVESNRGGEYSPDAGGTPHSTTYDGSAGSAGGAGGSDGGSDTGAD